MAPPDRVRFFTPEMPEAGLRRRRHEPVAEVGLWLNRVVQGYFNYHAIPSNLRRLEGFRSEVCRAWRHALLRRSQRHRLSWERFNRLARRHVPHCRKLHPTRRSDFMRHDLRQEPYAVTLHVGICAAGRRSTAVPTATGFRVSQKQADKGGSRFSRRSVSLNSSAPPSEVIVPPSKPATTDREKCGANWNRDWLHSVIAKAAPLLVLTLCCGNVYAGKGGLLPDPV